MEIHCDFVPHPRWSLQFPADFRSLKVVARGGQDPEALRAAADGIARPAEDPNHLYLDPEAVKRLAGSASGSPSWLTGFDRMMAYATERGWTDEDGKIRAHVEWVD